MMAEEQAVQLGVYQHFRGGRYEVVGVGKHTETAEVLVVYQSMSGGSLWARPIKMFIGKVEHNGQMVPRFQLVQGDFV